MARVDFSVRAHERRRMGPGPLRHLAHLANLACIAHAVHLAKTHMGRRARVATPASKTARRHRQIKLIRRCMTMPKHVNVVMEERH